MPLVTVSISMHVRCAKCQSTVQLGAIVDRARCPKCGHVEALPPDRWRKAMDTASNDGPNHPRDPGAQLLYDDDEIWLIARNEPPRCASCGAALPSSAAENGRSKGGCFCVGCGAKIAVRPVPPALAQALPGITHLFGEDGTQLKTPDAAVPDPSQVVAVRCPDCGGNIQPDGRSRAVRCPYCAVLVVLPQAIWARLHTGKNDPHKFYLVHDPSLPRALGRADVEWSSLDGLCCDPQGNLYGVATTSGFDEEHMVFALDRQLRTTWVRRSVPLEDDGGIAWRNDGTLFVWSKRRYSAIVLRAADGQELGKVGGEQPKDLDRHVLDLSLTDSLAIDFDGTFLFTKRKRLARCAPDGSGIPTWPPGTGLFSGLTNEKLRPFVDASEEDVPSLEDVGDRPTKAYVEVIRIGWDGLTYLRYSEVIVCFDRTGKKLWSAKLPDNAGNHDLGIDARGIIYAHVYLGQNDYGIVRMLPGGKTSSLLIDGRNPSTPTRDERNLAVFPDGTMVLAGYAGRLRIFAPDGRMLHRSQKSIHEDEEHARKQTQRRDRDIAH
jgi:DNA-directed RNA polymerase subunit RPC12/RpoP